MRVGLVYDLFEDFPWEEGDPFDADVENEPLETLEILEEAILRLGHQPVRVGGARDLLKHMDNPDFDVVVNIAEGSRGRNREGEAPALLEMMGVPFVGSDALTLSLSLDKAWTKDLAIAAGLRTPAYRCYSSSIEIDADTLPGAFPLYVKPRYEGSAKGLTTSSKVNSVDALRSQVDHIATSYGQSVIVEQFIEGSEFTVAVIGADPVRTMPVIQRATERHSGIGLHALDRKGLPKVDHDFELTGDLSSELELVLSNASVAVFNKLECKDFSRVDFRVNTAGQEWFLEINPLPTFAPDGTFGIMAELDGQSYPDFLSMILRDAFERVLP